MSTIPASTALLQRFRRAFRGDAETVGGEVLLPIEGPRLIADALRAGLRLEVVLFSREGEARHSAKLRPQLAKQTMVAVAGEEAFRRAMDVEHPQGAAALARWRPARLGALLAGRGGALADSGSSGSLPAGPIAGLAALPASGHAAGLAAGGRKGPALLVAAGLQDPGNLGTLIRAADAFGADGLITLTPGVGPTHPKAIRASAGSLFRLPVAPEVSPAALINACRDHQIALLATAARGPQPVAAADLGAPVCLLIGHESAGLPRSLQRAAAATVTIPMTAEVESLNAALAGAVILYEAARQRLSKESAAGTSAEPSVL